MRTATATATMPGMATAISSAGNIGRRLALEKYSGAPTAAEVFSKSAASRMMELDVSTSATSSGPTMNNQCVDGH